MPTATQARPVHAGPTLHVPTVLPTVIDGKYAGQPIAHLSYSSYNLWINCPEAWRKRYVLGIKQPATPAMFLGTAVDHALSTMYQQRIAGTHLDASQVQDVYRDGWDLKLAEQDQGVAWTAQEPADRTRERGHTAIEVFLKQLEPQLGEPVAVQREMTFKLSPWCRWEVLCYMDLETILTGAQQTKIPAVADFKVKAKLISQTEADADMQVSTYFAGRVMERNPISQFVFAVMRKPGKGQNSQWAAGLTCTVRDINKVRGTLVRYARMATAINAMYEHFGPENRWDFADPTNWRCSATRCAHYATCPGGAGI